VIATLVILPFQLPHAAWPSSTTSTARRSHGPSMRSGPCSRPAGSLCRARPGYGFKLWPMSSPTPAHMGSSRGSTGPRWWYPSARGVALRRTCAVSEKGSDAAPGAGMRPGSPCVLGASGNGRTVGMTAKAVVCAPCRQRDPLNHEHRDGCGELRLRKAHTASGGLCPAAAPTPTRCARPAGPGGRAGSSPRQHRAASHVRPRPGVRPCVCAAGSTAG
jgi:hypothetical protein